MFVVQGGMYMLQLIDNYAATYSLLIIGLFECITIAYIYGTHNHCSSLHASLAIPPALLNAV